MHNKQDVVFLNGEASDRASTDALEQILRTGTAEEIDRHIKSPLYASPPGRFVLQTALMRCCKQQRLEMSLLTEELTQRRNTMIARFLKEEGDAPLLLISSLTEADIRDLKAAGIRTIRTLVALTKYKRILKAFHGDESRARRVLSLLQAEGFPLMAMKQFRTLVNNITGKNGS